MPKYFLILLITVCTLVSSANAQVDFKQALDDAKSLLQKLKDQQDTSTSPATPSAPATEAPNDPPRSKIQETLGAVLADTSSDAAGARDTIRIYVNSAMRGLGGHAPVHAANAYGAAGAILFLKQYYDEAAFCYAMAAEAEPTNSEWLNNLATALLERQKTSQAQAILEELISLYPNMDPPMASLAEIYLETHECEKAIPLIEKAIALSPTTGLYYYLYGSAKACNGDSIDAKAQYKKSWANGFSGSGREGDPGNQSVDPQNPGHDAGHSTATPDAASNNDLNTTVNGKAVTPYPAAPNFDGKPIPKEWAGHYEADYVRAKRLRTKQYGQGMSGTSIREDILTCAKSFSMDISASGSISGHAKVMYVYLGTASNAMMSMAPAVAVARLGNFSATLKNGFQIRDFHFTGQVDARGVVEIKGMPEGKMDFYNVGKWQQIDPWNVLPPPDRSPRSPARMVLATDTNGVPSIYINRDVDFNGDLSLTYQAFIRKSTTPIVCNCKRLEAKPPTCPQSQYLKAKATIGAEGKMTVESSRDLQGNTSTTTKVSGGLEGNGIAASAGVDAAGNVSFEGNVGALVGSSQYNMQDGSYSMTIGVGFSSSSVLPGPNKISEKLELVYDSACGWGIKGTAGVSTIATGAGVEGAIYFNKGH